MNAIVAMVRRPLGPIGPIALLGRGAPLLLLVWGASAATLGCSPERQRFTRDADTLIVGRAAGALNLDPGRASDSESVEITEQIFENLLSYNPATGLVEPGLARSWTIEDDGRRWTFVLRDGVRFHDGTRLDADAVVFSLERQRDPNHPFHSVPGESAPYQYWASTYGNIRRVRKVAPLEVEIVLDRAFSPFEATISMFPVGIVSPTAVRESGAEFSRKPIGSGPYRFRDWAGDRIVLERNPDYWGPKPAMKHLVFRAIPDPAQRLVALESAAIDVAYQAPPDALPFVDLHPSLATYEAPVANVAYIALNNSRTPMSDPRVRRALNHAVDRIPIVKIAYRDRATEAVGPLQPGQWGYHRPTTIYDYDPDKARALLAEAAADGTFDPARVHRLFAPSTPRPYVRDPELVTEIVAAQLEAVGFRVETVIQQFGDHLASVRGGEHDLCLHGWVADNADPDNVIYTLLAIENTQSGVARNLAFYRDEALQALLTEARESADRTERAALYARAQERISRGAPWVPLAHSKITVAVSADLEGIILTPTGHVAHRQVHRRE